MVKYIDCTPTWSDIIKLCFNAMEDRTWNCCQAKTHKEQEAAYAAYERLANDLKSDLLRLAEHYEEVCEELAEVREALNKLNNTGKEINKTLDIYI